MSRAARTPHRPPSERPSKRCAACGRPFTWRRKWARDWENVIYCSDRCRDTAKRDRATRRAEPPEAH